MPDLIQKRSPAYRQGDNLNNTTAILLSAPGQEEEKAGRPAAGETGKTLQMAIEILHKKDTCNFPSPNLDDYTVANSIETIHYKNKTGKTEATDSEICESANIERIKNILSTYKTVVSLGDKANLAIQTAKYRGVVFSANHPSLQSLNSKYKSGKGTSGERRKDRIELWVKDLIKSKKYLKG